MNPTSNMIKAMKARHAMVSFEHPEQIAEAVEVCQSVVLDNGAFSAWKQQKPHDFDGYIEWAEHWIRHPAVDWCVIPDKIDGTEKENEELVSAWTLPCAVSVPVFHLHESLDYLRRLMGSFHRIALGSSGEFSDPNSKRWWGRIADVMDVLCDNEGMPLVKIHGLRMLDPDVFSRIPLSSADSCNVARNIGLDSKWNGTYVPNSKWVRALVIIDRIESHASARRWNGETSSRNFELFG